MYYLNNLQRALGNDMDMIQIRKKLNWLPRDPGNETLGVFAYEKLARLIEAASGLSALGIGQV